MMLYSERTRCVCSLLLIVQCTRQSAGGDASQLLTIHGLYISIIHEHEAHCGNPILLCSFGTLYCPGPPCHPGPPKLSRPSAPVPPVCSTAASVVVVVRTAWPVCSAEGRIHTAGVCTQGSSCAAVAWQPLQRPYVPASIKKPAQYARGRSGGR